MAGLEAAYFTMYFIYNSGLNGNWVRYAHRRVCTEKMFSRMLSLTDSDSRCRIQTTLNL